MSYFSDKTSGLTVAIKSNENTNSVKKYCGERIFDSSWTGTIGTCFNIKNTPELFDYIQDIPSTIQFPVLYCDTVHFLTTFVIVENGILKEITKDPTRIIYPLFDKWGGQVSRINWPAGCLEYSLSAILRNRIQQHTKMLKSDLFLTHLTMSEQIQQLKKRHSEVIEMLQWSTWSNNYKIVYSIMNPEALRLSKLIKELKTLKDSM
jgi:hypothetical protein